MSTEELPRVWYPAIRKPGGGTKIVSGTAAHLLFRGIFLCRKTPIQAILAAKADTGIVRQGVIPGETMCQECQDAYKANPVFPLKHWEESVKNV